MPTVPGTLELLAGGQGRLKYPRVALALWASISAGELAPGDRLPTVTQLASRHQVPRATVSRALKLLEQQDLIAALDAGYQVKPWIG